VTEKDAPSPGSPRALPLDPTTRFRVPSRRVAADVVDDEVVIVDLASGSYFTTEGAGCDVWRLLAGGASVDETVAVLRTRYVDTGAVESYVHTLTAVVVERGLLEPAHDDTDGAPVDLGPAAGVLAPVGEPRPFAAADLVDFDDMKGLLLIDPVHEVDDRGWPHAGPGL